MRATTTPKRWIHLCLSIGLLTGCGAGRGRISNSEMSDELEKAVAVLRQSKGLLPLAYDEVLNRTAADRAATHAQAGNTTPDHNRLPILIAAGAYARFALTHELSADSLDAALKQIRTDPVAMSKMLHPSLTHFGMGSARRLGRVYVALDFARLAPDISPDKTVVTINQSLREKREKNSLAPLELDGKLEEIASDIAGRFMSGRESSNALIAEAQGTLEGRTFAFGRVTISFQVASDPGAIMTPERSGDPSLAFVGIGVAQGNHPEHESGAVAVVILLAEPQTAHDASRTITNLPPPKAAPRKETAPKDQTLPEQAWMATLTGNHGRAARLFEKAFRQSMRPGFIYEAARSHARNGDLESALEHMKRYAAKVDGPEKDKAEEMIAKLSAGISIFSASRSEKMSTEAKRFFVMGQRLYQEAEWDGAVDAFQQAYQYSPHPDIIYNIGLAHHRAGRIGEALDFFGEYQRLVPEATNVEEARQFFDIGVEFYRTGRFESASRHFAMAYSFLPFPELVYNLALCYKAMGDREKALLFFREYLENELEKSEREKVQQEIDALNRK